MSQSSAVNSEQSEILNKLKEVQFFKMYAGNDTIMDQIAQLCSRKKFKEGETIITEGEPGDELYIMLKGEIEIVKETLQKEKYTVVTLNADMGGIYVGELALIDSDKRSASVIAKTECEFLVIKRESFIKFGDENPQVGLQVTRVIASQLSSKLRKTNTDVVTLFSALVNEIATED